MPGNDRTAGPARSRAADAAAPNVAGYQLMESTIPGQMGKDETSLFEGIDTSLTALAQFAGPNPPAALTAGLAAIVDGGQARAEGIR